MMVEDYLKALVFRFKETLDSKERVLECFCNAGVQIEGWLKGEFLYFLSKEKEARNIIDFHRETLMGMGRKKIDFKVDFQISAEKMSAWVELKHWLIGKQKGRSYNAQFYFGDQSSVGIRPDVEKLKEITDGSKVLLILTTKRPEMNDWEAGIEKFNNKFSSLHLEPLTAPTDFPSSYFLGLLKISMQLQGH